MTRAPVVVITGASAGLGRATARAFARGGFDVALIGRRPERLAAARSEVEERGRRALDVPVDVADHPRLQEAAALIETDLGPIDVWVNSAMVSVFSPLKDMSTEEFRRVTEVTYLGYVYGTMTALDRMLVRDRGCIVQVGSALAHRAIPLQAAYCGAKHAIRGFTDSVPSELLHDNSGVRLTTCPLSTHLTSGGSGRACRVIRGPFRPCTSRRLRPMPSCGRRGTIAGRSTSALRRRRP